MTLAGLQFVIWPRPRNWHVGYRRLGDDALTASCLIGIYKWFLWLGPLEVRKWR